MSAIRTRLEKPARPLRRRWRAPRSDGALPEWLAFADESEMPVAPNADPAREVTEKLALRRMELEFGLGLASLITLNNIYFYKTNLFRAAGRDEV